MTTNNKDSQLESTTTTSSTSDDVNRTYGSLEEAMAVFAAAKNADTVAQRDLGLAWDDRCQKEDARNAAIAARDHAGFVYSSAQVAQHHLKGLENQYDGFKAKLAELLNELKAAALGEGERKADMIRLEMREAKWNMERVLNEAYAEYKRIAELAGMEDQIGSFHLGIVLNRVGELRNEAARLAGIAKSADSESAERYGVVQKVSQDASYDLMVAGFALENTALSLDIPHSSPVKSTAA